MPGHHTRPSPGKPDSDSCSCSPLMCITPARRHQTRASSWSQPTGWLRSVAKAAMPASMFRPPSTLQTYPVAPGTLGNPAAAAKAKSWTCLLQSSVTTLAEACDHALQLVAEQDILSPRGQATSPACAPSSCACLLCTARHAACACSGLCWTGVIILTARARARSSEVVLARPQ